MTLTVLIHTFIYVEIQARVVPLSVGEAVLSLGVDGRLTIKNNTDRPSHKKRTIKKSDF